MLELKMLRLPSILSTYDYMSLQTAFSVLSTLCIFMMSSLLPLKSSALRYSSPSFRCRMGMQSWQNRIFLSLQHWLKKQLNLAMFAKTVINMLQRPWWGIGLLGYYSSLNYFRSIGGIYQIYRLHIYRGILYYSLLNSF